MSVYSLVDGEYQLTQFGGDDQVVSPMVEGFELMAAKILQWLQIKLGRSRTIPPGGRSKV